jgi:hypothetical protein
MNYWSSTCDESWKIDVMNFYKQCIQHVKFCVGYLKVILEAFGIEYEDIEDNLTNWKVKKC